MGLLQENRSYTLVLDGKELNPQLTIEDCIHKMGLKENDKLTLWARVVGGAC